MLLGACIPPILLDQPSPAALLLGLYVTAALSYGAWTNVWRVKWLALAFLVVTTLLWPLFHRTQEAPLIRIWPIVLSHGSLAFSLTMGLRMISLLMAGVIFLSGTRIEDISYGLQKLGLPFRMAFAFSLAFRLTPLFMTGAAQIATAQKVRGLDLETAGWIQRIRGYLAILTPVLITALRRTDGLAMALESKGFGRSASRTSILEYQVTWRDGLLLSITALLVVFAAAWHWRLFDFPLGAYRIGHR
jgi:energy-coupling factor transport system permease protein